MSKSAVANELNEDSSAMTLGKEEDMTTSAAEASPLTKNPGPLRPCLTANTPRSPESALADALAQGHEALRAPTPLERARLSAQACAAFLGALALVDRLPVLEVELAASPDGDDVEVSWLGTASFDGEADAMNCVMGNLSGESGLHERQEVRVTGTVPAVAAEAACTPAGDDVASCEHCRALNVAKITRALDVARARLLEALDAGAFASMQITLNDPDDGAGGSVKLWKNGDEPGDFDLAHNDADLAHLAHELA